MWNFYFQAVYTYGQYVDEPLSMDHVPTSQPTSQPASQPAAGGTGILPVTENTPTATPEVVSSPLSLVTSTALPSATLNSELITQNSPIPSVPSATSVVEIPSATAVPTNTAELLPTIPPDPYATQAMSLLTPVPTDTPVALQTSPPDPYATQAAQMTESSTPAPQSTVTQATTPQVITSPTPTGTPVQMLGATSQPALERYYYHANRLYNVCALTNSEGNVVERYQYNAYGLCTTFNANYELPLAFSRFGNPFTFTGRELDPETDLMHYRRRTYSPRQGRFVQTDPIGYTGGINLYEYVHSSPIIWIDPNGSNPLIITIGAVATEAGYTIYIFLMNPRTQMAMAQYGPIVANGVIAAMGGTNPPPGGEPGVILPNMVFLLTFISEGIGGAINVTWGVGNAINKTANDIINILFPPQPPAPPLDDTCKSCGCFDVYMNCLGTTMRNDVAFNITSRHECSMKSAEWSSGASERMKERAPKSPQMQACCRPGYPKLVSSGCTARF